jgi:hypothetical protein
MFVYDTDSYGGSARVCSCESTGTLISAINIIIMNGINSA